MKNMILFIATSVLFFSFVPVSFVQNEVSKINNVQLLSHQKLEDLLTTSSNYTLISTINNNGITTTKRSIGDGLYEMDIEIPIWKIQKGVIKDICKKYFDSYLGRMICSGVLGASAYIFNCATYGSSYEGSFDFFGLHYWYVYSHGDHIHFVITTTQVTDFSGCKSCA